jgi:release factor glutamine methyltransferase
VTDVSAQYRVLLTEVQEFWEAQADKPEETLEGVARALWLTAAGTPVSIQKALEMVLPALDPAGSARLQNLISLKKSGMPLSHITERQNFLEVELIAGPGALIPRKETEILGRAALLKLQTLVQERGEALVLDVCTGSGNLALALAVHEPRCRVFGADLSQPAIDLAEKNRAFTGLGTRVEFRQGDLLSPFDSVEFLDKVDLLTCNPPYISAAKVPKMPKEISAFEPSLAFNGGAFGVSILTKLVREAPRFLRSSSWLCFEVGLGQGKVLAEQLRQNPEFSAVETHPNEAGAIRALSVQKA